MAKANRKYKDSVLVNFFSESPEKLVELYNAIEGTNYPKDTKRKILKLKSKPSRMHSIKTESMICLLLLMDRWSFL